MIDWTTFVLANLLNLASFLLALLAFSRRQKELHSDNVRRFTQIETKVDAMWAWFANKMDQINGRSA